MATKIHYEKEDDIFTVYDDKHKLSETIEFSEFLNIDIDKNKSIVEIEIFYASEFFSALNIAITKSLLESVDNVSIDCNNYRNNWFIILTFDYNNQKLRVQMPPMRKSEYTSPLIASCRLHFIQRIFPSKFGYESGNQEYTLPLCILCWKIK